MAALVCREALKMYAVLYFGTQYVLVRRLDWLSHLRSLRSVLQSTTFLSLNALFTLSLFCATRRVLGQFYLPLVGHLPAAISSYFALLIERPGRRSALAFYCANIAAETILFGRLNRRLNQQRVADKWNSLSTQQRSQYSPKDQAVFQTLAQRQADSASTDFGLLVKATNNDSTVATNGDAATLWTVLRQSLTIDWLRRESVVEWAMFTSGVVGLVCLRDKRRADGKHQDLINTAMSILLGDKPATADTRVDKKGDNMAARLIQRLRSLLPSPDTRLKSALGGSVRGFLLGYSAQSLFSALMHLKRWLSGQVKGWPSLINRQNGRVGIQLALFVGAFRFFQQVEQEKNSSLFSSSAMAALVAAIATKWFAPIDLNLTQYLFWKWVENVFWHQADRHRQKKETLVRQYKTWLAPFVDISPTDSSVNLLTEPAKQVHKVRFAEHQAMKAIDKSTDASPERLNGDRIECGAQWPDWLNETIDRLASKQLGSSVFNLFSPDTLIRFIYSVSVAQLFYVQVMSPQTMRSSYCRFMDRVTNNRFRLLNRNVIDQLGVESSAGNPLYVPRLQFEHTTRQFQENVLFWML